jgi:hypothetical protein
MSEAEYRPERCGPAVVFFKPDEKNTIETIYIQTNQTMQKILTIILIFTMSTVGIAQKKKGTTITNDLSEQEVKGFHKQCQIKVQEFQEYLPVIADKTRTDFDRQEAVEAAERLFNAGSTIQVTSKNSKPNVYVYKGKCKPSRPEITFLSSVSLKLSYLEDPFYEQKRWIMLIESVSIITP